MAYEEDWLLAFNYCKSRRGLGKGFANGSEFAKI
jgi:hypothetical protein